MMTYDALSFLLKAVIRFGLYMLLCISIYMLSASLRKKSPVLIVPTFLSVLISGSMFVLYDARSQKSGLDHRAAVRWLCEKPILFTILLFAAAAVLLTYVTFREAHLRRTVPDRSSIKESIDHLPTGLCFYAENGRVMLVNHRMNQLCHIILGRDLQNAALVWDDLCGGSIQPDIMRLSTDSQPRFRLSDGTVWSFSRTQLPDMFQITAVDITQLHNLAEELEQKNIALEELYQRLKVYETDVEVLTRTRERLELKIGIHSELGQTLLATRSYLLDNNENKTIPVEAWKRSIALLRQNIVENAEQFTLQTLIQTATAFGISVEVTGQMPEQKDVEKLFLEAATEALTNAVRHADAKKLHISLTETADTYRICFQNDGKMPETQVTEGGGLGSLRRKAETAGGSMQIDCHPEYSLTISMPKGGTERI